MFRKKEAEYMVDVHCHMIPGVDDGSRSMQETLQMLKIAERQGTTHVIVTPHFKNGHHNASPKKVEGLLNDIRAEAEEAGINISLYQGNEVFYYDEMCEELDTGKISTINGTGYVLVEFLPTDTFVYIRNALDNIISEGYTPILAHVERYSCMLDNTDNVSELRQLGVSIQTNASSITGDTGKDIKKYVHKLLKDKLIDYVGTDSHRAEGRRIPGMKACSELLYKKYDKDYVDEILYLNAMDNLLG